MIKINKNTEILKETEVLSQKSKNIKILSEPKKV